MVKTSCPTLLIFDSFNSSLTILNFSSFENSASDFGVYFKKSSEGKPDSEIPE